MSTLSLPPLTARLYTGEADLPSIADLLNACEVVDQLDAGTSVEELRQEFSYPHTDPLQNVRLWLSEDNQLLAIGQVWMRLPNEILAQKDTAHYWFKVHPTVRHQGIEAEILAWAEERIRQIGQTRSKSIQLFANSRETQSDRIAFLESHGFTSTRYFYRMQRSLLEPIPDPQLPAGFTVQTLTPDQVEAWVEMFNQSFIDHWNFEPLTLDDRQHWLSDPTYRADLDLVAVAPDGTFVTFCLGWISPEENARSGRNQGWIGDLGTRRGFRRLGLGRALLLSGLHRLQQAGVETALLGVDAENPSGALRLYESVGFRQVFSSIVYAKTIPNH